VANVILFGPPGAGKGTQAKYLVDTFSLFKISSGDLLRKEIKNETELGNKIKSIIDQGSLVDDNYINGLIEKIISNKKYFNMLIFDGYPRNINQAKTLDSLIKKYDQKISCVFSLKVDHEVVVKRILGRQTCSSCGLIFNTFFSPSTKENHNCDEKHLQKRSDDNKETIIKRIKTYDIKTLPILNYYSDQNLLCEIDGMREISIIYKEIRAIMHTLDT
tara:strand:- start:4100 stop:4753 length:654 start_codon:yes stop_codon:yes gene_type:complete